MNQQHAITKWIIDLAEFLEPQFLDDPACRVVSRDRDCDDPPEAKCAESPLDGGERRFGGETLSPPGGVNAKTRLWIGGPRRVVVQTGSADKKARLAML